MPMNTCKNTHNTLIHRGFTPPHNHASISEGNPLPTASPLALLHTALVRVGRASLFLVLAASFALSACAKESPVAFDNEEPLSPHPTWTDDSTNNFWSQPS